MSIIERDFVLDGGRCREASVLMAGIAGTPAPSLGLLPPSWHWWFSHETPLDGPIGRDGHPLGRLDGVPEDYVRRMWAGSEICFRTTPRIGQLLTLRMQTGTAVLKDGTSGPLAFVPMTVTVSAGDSLVLEERRTGVYCPARQRNESAPASPRLDAMPDALPGSAVVTFSEIDLFRYSSLLKVFHRIHYDAPFTLHEEGHPGLVVHGPLLAQALILRAMELHPGFRASDVAVLVRRATYVNCPVHLVVDVDSETGDICATALNEQKLPAMIVKLTSVTSDQT